MEGQDVDLYDMGTWRGGYQISKTYKEMILTDVSKYQGMWISAKKIFANKGLFWTIISAVL